MPPSLIYGVCALILLWYLVKGWRKGPARMVISILALGAAYIAGVLFGDAVVPLLRPLGFADLVLVGIARAATGLVAYLVIVAFGAILFKRTDQQDFGVVRFLYGLSGAGLGLVFGLVLIWGFVIAVRLAGSLTPTSVGKEAPILTEGGLPARLVDLARSWKDELDGGPVSALVKAADPLPASVYVSVDRTGRVLSNPAAARRFLQAPALRDWVSDPKLRALTDDPELQRALRDRDYAVVLRHPKVVDFLNEPKLIDRLKQTDLNGALEFALEEKK